MANVIKNFLFVFEYFPKSSCQSGIVLSGSGVSQIKNQDARQDPTLVGVGNIIKKLPIAEVIGKLSKLEKIHLQMWGVSKIFQY